jgi:hypothetical protein
VSFFDEGDEPTRVSRPARPRRPATGARSGAGPANRPGGRRPPGGGGGVPDQHTARVRQAVLIGVVILFLILFAVVINGCRTSARKRSLKDYNRNVFAVMTDSNDSVSQPFFRLLDGGSSQAGGLQSAVNQLRIAAEEDVKRAKGFDVPGEMKRAQSSLTLVLDLRAAALGKVGDELPTAVAQSAGSASAASEAINKIAGQMQAFLASDVVYSQRVIPYIKQTLDDNGVGGQEIATSNFLPNIGWLNPDSVASRLNSRLGGRNPNGPPAPGTHGHGLTSVSIGGKTLTPSPAVNRIPAAAGLTFDVKFANQGENDEIDVRVLVAITGSGKTITVRKTLNQTKAGTPAEANIPLDQSPPIGQAVTIKVQIVGVPGEKNLDNNKQSYTAFFTR